ncbi:TetR/AcrR family transcriptional regulator [Pseudomonas fulva]|uniref:TetR/AcrR family transcriptional regulator n=1 Tax=Pseudomonas fulva TaxID=47880 RepID=UPI00201E3AE5|nr:TetR/AcrR family transcriptional regulator [Pseudomonas fulva]UQY33039.1 TetR/AcrR family transcriptional regulator [Pseudomonas fulva]
MKDAGATETPLSKTELSRQRLLDAAAECFRKEGFHGTSIARISRAAGMSAGHIYHFFASKESIVQAIAEREEHDIANLQQDLEENVGKDLAEILATHTGKMIQRSTDPAHASLTLELAAEATRNPAVRDILQQSDREIGSGFQQKVRRMGAPAGIDENKLHVRMQIVVAIMEGLRLRVLCNPGLDLAAVENEVNNIIHFLLREPD